MPLLQKPQTNGLGFYYDRCKPVDFCGKSGIIARMDLDSQKIDELLELTRENNQILRSMRRTQRWSSFFTFVYWAIILGSIFGVYYYFQPTIQKYMRTMQTSVSILEKFEEQAGALPTDLNVVKNLLGR